MQSSGSYIAQLSTLTERCIRVACWAASSMPSSSSAATPRPTTNPAPGYKEGGRPEASQWGRPNENATLDARQRCCLKAQPKALWLHTGQASSSCLRPARTTFCAGNWTSRKRRKRGRSSKFSRRSSSKGMGNKKGNRRGAGGQEGEGRSTRGGGEGARGARAAGGASARSREDSVHELPRGGAACRHTTRTILLSICNKIPLERRRHGPKPVDRALARASRDFTAPAVVHARPVHKSTEASQSCPHQVAVGHRIPAASDMAPPRCNEARRACGRTQV